MEGKRPKLVHLAIGIENATPKGLVLNLFKEVLEWSRAGVPVKLEIIDRLENPAMMSKIMGSKPLATIFSEFMNIDEIVDEEGFLGYTIKKCNIRDLRANLRVRKVTCPRRVPMLPELAREVKFSSSVRDRPGIIDVG